MNFFGPKSFFLNFPTLFVTIMTGHQKDKIFVLTPLHGCSQKKGFGPKNSFFGPQKGHFGQLGPRNGPPGGQTATYRKTEGIQSYLRIWGTYDPIESGPSELKKWGFHRCSVKKCRISGRKCIFLAQNPFFLPRASNYFVTIMTGQQKDNIFV